MSKEAAEGVSQDGQYKDATDKYDASHGKYKDAAESIPEDQKFATGNMPLQNQPSPFKLGPMDGGSDSGE